MKKTFLFFLSFIFLTSLAFGAVFMTEIADPNNNLNARYIELYNNGATAVDFTEGSGWRINKYTNGSATVSSFKNLTGTIAAGGFYILAYDATAGTFLSVYGFAANQLDSVSNGTAGGNGDDTLELLDGTGAVADFYGVQPHADLTSSPWEFEDGRAVRANSATSGTNPPVDADWNTWSDGPGGDTVQSVNAPGGFDPGAWTGTGGPTLPVISSISREYPVPTSVQTCWVQCDIVDGTTPYIALIKYDVDGISQTDITMSNIGGDTYQGTLPAQADGAVVEYYIDVTDAGVRANVTSTTYGLFWGTSDISTAAGDIKEVDANGVMVYDSYYARVTGVATVATGVFSSSNLDVYFQDSIGGIDIFQFSSGITITEGNEYTVFGIIDHYNGKSEIVTTDASTDITDNGVSVVPDPIVLTVAELLAAAETYEGMLVKIDNLDYVSGTWAANQNLTMNDGTGDITLRLDGDTDLDENTEPVWPKNVVGIIAQYDSSSPYTGGYQIFPRRYADITDADPLPVTLSSFYAIYTNDLLTISWSTQSETNNLGWNIYRGISDNLGQTSQINTEMIDGAGTTSEPTEYNYDDNSNIENNTTYWYWLESASYGGETNIYGPVYLEVQFDEETPITPSSYGLYQNYPNPFNPSTSISFALAGDSNVELIIYNIKGEKIKSIFNDHVDKNVTTISIWNGEDANGKQVSSGVYYYKLITDTKVYQKKMLLVK